MTLLSQLVSFQINQNSGNAIGSNITHVIVLKKMGSELSPIFISGLNAARKRNVSQVSGSFQLLSLFSGMPVSIHPHYNWPL